MAPSRVRSTRPNLAPSPFPWLNDAVCCLWCSSPAITPASYVPPSPCVWAFHPRKTARCGCTSSSGCRSSGCAGAQSLDECARLCVAAVARKQADEEGYMCALEGRARACRARGLRWRRCGEAAHEPGRQRGGRLAREQLLADKGVALVAWKRGKRRKAGENVKAGCQTKRQGHSRGGRIAPRVTIGHA